MGFATEGIDLGAPFTAKVDMSAKQYSAVTLDGAATDVDLLAATSEVCLGIVQNAPTAGQPATVRRGLTKAIAGGTVTRGQVLMSDAAAAGRVITATGAGVQTCGVALESAADGQIFQIDCFRGVLHA